MPYTEVMHKWKQGTLRSGGSGKKVTSQKQALAIMFSEKRKADSGNPEYMADNSTGTQKEKTVSGTLFGKPKSKVIRHPGALRRAAERAGESTHEYAEKHKHSSGKTGERSRLALTMMGWQKS